MKLRTIAEVAEIVGMSYGSIYQHLYQGHIAEPKQKVGASRMFDDAEVEAIKKFASMVRQKKDSLKRAKNKGGI